MAKNSPNLPDQMSVQEFLDAYRRERLEFQRDQTELGLFLQLPGQERDPKLNELAGKVAGRQAVLDSFAALVVDPTDGTD